MGIVAVAFKNQTIKLADKSWDTATNETREYFEKEFKCCGFYNYTDRPYLPACVFTVASSAIYDSSSSEIGTESKGCIDQIYDFINEYIVQIIVAIFVTFAIELVVLIFASILAYRIKVIHRNYSSMTDSQEDLFS